MKSPEPSSLSPLCRRLARWCLPIAINLAVAVPVWAILPQKMPQKNAAAVQIPAPPVVTRNPDAQQEEAAGTLKRAQPSALVNWDPSVGTPSQVSAEMLGGQTLSSAKGARSKAVNQGTYTQRAIAVMDNLAPLFRIKDATSDFKGPKPEETDRLGFRHQRLEQVYQGLPVVGGGVIVHFNASGAPYRVDGRFVPDISVDTNPAITSQASVEAAQADFATRGFSGNTAVVVQQPRLVVYARGSVAKLAYEIILQDSPVNSWLYWVDAMDGRVLATESRVCQIAPPTSTGGTAAPLTGNVTTGEGGGLKTFGGWSQNSVYYMYSPTNFYFVYNNNTATNSAPPAPTITADRIASADISAAAAYPDANTYAFRNIASWGTSDPVESSIAANMEASFGYYKSVHLRNGFNGKGKVVAAIAHYDKKLVNAYWTGAEMVFGDGDGVMANSLAVADVCAHELTHGVTETTANLDYQDESGALNESFSDIFGALVEFNSQPDGRASYPKASPGTGDWLCGEDCWLDGTALRDFRNPSSTVTLSPGYQQPSKYKGTYWQDYTTDPWDNGGVHQNSGVQNFFFYLLCEGGSGNNDGIAYNFTGIGIKDAEQVAYRALTVYCTATTDYKQVQNAWVTAANDLNSALVPVVKAAWRAVGIGITSALLVQGQAGVPITPYRITATDTPTAYSASGLPAGLSLSGNTISGTPTTAGEFDATISATTGGVTFSDTLHLSILDPTIPVVSIVSPVSGAKLPPDLPVPIVVVASDLDASFQPGIITQVDLYANGVLVGTDTTAPYEFYFTPPTLGSYAFYATATDSDGNIGTSPLVNVTVAYLSPGEIDYSFTPPVADDYVYALSADPDRRIYVGGLFTQLDGGSAPRIGRLRSDGSVDPSFYVGTGPNAQVRALLHVPQDKALYVGGYFANFNGTARRALVRLRTGQTGYVDGSVDPAFDPAIEGASSSATPYIRTIVRQDDGKILVGGFFSKVKKTNRSNLARFNTDGSLDTTFAPNPGGAVNSIALQADGKILVGGAFTQIAGQTSRRIARLNRDGTLDTTFVTGTGTSGGFDGAVNSVAVTLDGEVIVGGAFTSYNGRAFYNNMAKLLSTGAVDGKFNFTPGVNGVVNDVHLRPTGEILVSGLFTQIANNVLGIPATAVGRVAQMKSSGTENGTLDASFNVGGAGADGSVLDSMTLPSGDILLAGAFTNFNGEPRYRLAVIAGYDHGTPVLTSSSSYNIDAGADLDFSFTASGNGSFFYNLVGALPRGVTFDPATGALRGLPLDAGRYEFYVVATSVQGSTAATRFVLNVNDTKVSYAQWKKAWFSTAEQANKAVSDPDVVRNSTGLCNYLVYALGGGDPNAADASLVPVVQREKIGTKYYLTLTAPKYPASQATYRVECSSDLANWSWTSPADVVTISEDATQLKARAATPATEIGKQFLRLKVLAP